MDATTDSSARRDPESPDDSTAEPRSGWPRISSWWLIDDRWAIAAMLAVFATLILCGITTSSLGDSYLRQNADSTSGILAGSPQTIRYDEYNIGTPTQLSVMATGDVAALSPLAEPAGLSYRQPSTGIFDNVVLFDGQILRASSFIPQQMLFALRWWLPFILLFLSMPVWFRQLGSNGRLGWLAAFLVAFSPSVAWWSMQPVGVLAYTLTGATLMGSAFSQWRKDRRIWAIALTVLAGVLLAGMPAAYIPWSIMLGFTVLATSVVRLLSVPETRKAGLFIVALTALSSVVFGLGLLWDERNGLTAMLGTIYPGSRRNPSEAQPLDILFGAPGLTPMRSHAPAFSNASEVSTSWTIAFIWLLVLIFTSVRLRRMVRESLPALVVGVFGLAWLIWSSIHLGSWSAGIPIFNQIPGQRAGQVVGVLGVIAVCLFLGSGRVRVSNRIALLAAVLCGAITLYALSLQQQSVLPSAPTVNVLLGGLAVATAIYLVTRWPRRLPALAIAVVLAAIPSIAVNPVMVGLGDLRSSSAAQFFAQQAHDVRAAGQVWASDFRAMDVLMLANGLPSLSGPQSAGPNVAEWTRIDPKRQYKDAWNRGGSRIKIVWVADGSVTVTSNGYNVITLTADPCTLADRIPELTHIVSQEPLMNSCLTQAKKLPWHGSQVHEYTIHR